MVTWRPDFSKPLPDLLESVRKSINQVLEIMLDVEWDGRPELKEPARYSVQAGGKRIRPTMVILSAYACKKPPIFEGLRLFKAASSVEFLHTYSLIHDDLPCMDDDTLRRGKATCHVRYGVETALWAGSALLVEGFRQLSSTLEATDRAASALRVVAEAAGFSGMVGGQWLDLTLEGQQPTETRVRAIHLKKTAALFAGCCQLGGVLGNATDHEQQCLKRYGLSIGLAFQAVDDLLDVVGREAAVGKKTGKDRDAGKMTMTELRGISGSREIARDLVEAAVGAVESLKGPAVSSLVGLGYHLLGRTH